MKISCPEQNSGYPASYTGIWNMWKTMKGSEALLLWLHVVYLHFPGST